MIALRRGESTSQGSKRMWNPETYRDTDYGLNPDEYFEPEELDHDYPEPPQHAPHIQTVLGRIDPEDAGLALVREHLYRNPPDTDSDYQLTDRDAALLDLETFFTVGGRTVVDATTQGEGRSPERLIWLAQRAPVHIVASTGGKIGPNPAMSTIREMLGNSLTTGNGDSPALPGLVILEPGTDLQLQSVRDVFRILAEETEDRPLPVMTLLGLSDLSSVDVVKAATDAGIEASRIITTGIRTRNDESSLIELAQSGAYLLFDHLGEGTYEQDMMTASTIARLVEAGHGQQILLSHGYNRRSLLTGYAGGPGLGYIVEQFAIMLLEAGAAALDVRTMLLDNCASALTIQSKPS